MAGLKNAAKAVVPQSVVLARRRWLLRRTRARYSGVSNAEIFTSVYDHRYWGETNDGGVSSGDGSQDPAIYGPYVKVVTEFLALMGTPPCVVDLGCGDFNVGSRIRPYCADYIACDVVDSVIERNRTLFADQDVDFRTVDIARDPLPAGDVVVIRQVLQHLSNAEIMKVLPKLAPYQFALITDHQPRGDFVPNLDIPSGPHIRVGLGSALDLTRPPFALPHVEARDLCVVPDGDSVIRTTLFRLR